MRKILILMLIGSTLSLSSLAQQKTGKITGVVTDGSAKVLESATITLLRAGDSTVAKISVADRTGAYSFEDVPAGRYIVSISAVGHQKGWSAPVEVSGGAEVVTVKTIDLIPEAKTISAVTVTAKKPLIEQKPDRTVVNVEASVTNVGNSALEVLEKSPGVTVDKDGNISLRGKQGVQIYIDGRPSYLSGADLANLLKSMSSSQLDQIEIMTNPPAKYDAAGNAGVINIKTKKNKMFGFNGSLTTGYTQGRYGRFNESGNFNYRNGKFNLFSSLNYNSNKNEQELFIYRNFRETSTKNILSIFDQEAKMNNKSEYYNAKAGFDYNASKKTTLGIVLNTYYNPSNWTSNTVTSIFDPQRVFQSQTMTLSSNTEKWKNYSGNFNFRTTIDTAGQELTGDLDYMKYSSASTQPLTSAYFDAHGLPVGRIDTLNGALPSDIRIASAKLDYTKPLKKGAKFEAGLKSSFVKTDNNAMYDSIINGQSVHDYNRSNHFVYDENINAAYVNYSQPLNKKWNAQIGLRLENTIAKGKQLTTGVNFSRNYTQLFPTAYLQYAMNEKNQFVLNYGRRVERPDYGDLNPFIHFIDRYTFEQGNPNLAPQFSHNVELSHTYKGFLTTTVNYSKTKDIIQQVLEQNEATHETYIRRANIASQEQVGLTVTAYKEIKKWWTASVYANLAYNRFKGLVNNEPVDLDIAMYLVQVQQQFKWGKGWAAEVSGFYRSKGLEGVLFIKPIAQVNAGFSKQVMKNKATLKLSFNDIFAMSVFRGYSQYGTVDARFKNVNDRQTAGLSFNWRFNKGKLKASGSRHEGSASEEANRVKTGH